jgi:hypothetical protein
MDRSETRQTILLSLPIFNVSTNFMLKMQFRILIAHFKSILENHALVIKVSFNGGISVSNIKKNGSKIHVFRFCEI